MKKTIAIILVLIGILSISVFADLKIQPPVVVNPSTVIFPSSGDSSVSLQVTLSNDLNTVPTLLSGTLAWLPGDNNANELVSSNNAVSVNGAAFTASGKVRQAFSLDGTNDYFYIPHSTALEPVSGLTVEAWINSNNLAGNRYIIGNGDSCWAKGYALYLDSNGMLRFRLGNSGAAGACLYNGYSSVVGTSNLKGAGWHHVAATYDGSTMRVYVDGAEQKSASRSGTIYYSDWQTNIGADGISGSYIDMNTVFSGLIDEVTVYSRALSTSELQTIFNAGANGKYVPATINSALVKLDPQTQNGLTISSETRVTSLAYGPTNRKTAILTFTVPRTTPVGAYTFTLRALDESNTVNTGAETFALTINPAASFSLQKEGVDLGTAPIQLLGERGELTELELTLKNTGNVDLTNILLSHDFITTLSDSTNGASNSLIDDDEDEVSLTITPSAITSLPRGSTASIKLQADVDAGFDVKKLSSSLVLTAAGFPEFKQPFEININPLACPSSASSNKFELDIVEPDSDQEFEPGDTVNLRIDVRNKASDDKDVKLEAMLYNSDKNRKVDSQTSTKQIDSDEEESYLFKFPLDSADIADDDNYVIYIKAFERDEENLLCTQESLDIDLEVPENRILVSSFNLNPSLANCGTTVSSSVVLNNVGNNDEDVVIRAENSDLGLSYVSSPLFISEDDDENSLYHSFTFPVSRTLVAGSYPVNLRVSYSGYSTEESSTLTVSCGSSQGAASSSSGQVSVTSNTDLRDLTGETEFEEKSFFEKFNTGSYKIPTLAWVLIDIALVAIILAALVLTLRKR